MRRNELLYCLLFVFALLIAGCGSNNINNIPQLVDKHEYEEADKGEVESENGLIITGIKEEQEVITILSSINDKTVVAIGGGAFKNA